MLTFRFSGVDGAMTVPETLTSGMVGKKVKFELSKDWEGLRKTVVYTAGDIVRTTLDAGEVDTIPAEILAEPLCQLHVGIYGVNQDGTLVIPTVHACGPTIRPGACPSGDPSTDPALPVWLQLFTMITAMGGLTSEEEAQLAAAIRESVQTGGGSLSASGAGDAIVITTNLWVGADGDTIMIGGAA